MLNPTSPIRVIRSSSDLEGLGEIWEQFASVSGMPMLDHAWAVAYARIRCMRKTSLR